MGRSASRHLIGLQNRRLGRDHVTLEQIVAGCALFVVGMRDPWHMGLTTGYVLALLLLPLTLPSLASYRWSKSMVGLLGLCLAYGLLVTTWTSSTHVISSQARVQAISLHVGIVVSVILVLWARTVMRPGAIAIFIGLGGIVSVGPPIANLTDTWKFGYSIPVTLVVLGAASLWAGWKRAVVALCVLGGVTLFSDARSLFATYVAVAGMVVWSVIRSQRRGHKSKLSAVALGLAALFLVYKIADYLVLKGFLGEQAQQRSIQDAARSGSTLLGGRPELSATYALMRDHFAGYGLGTLPSTHDVAVGNSALIRMGLQPTHDGFSHYMFGRGQFELHSIFGDLWAIFGPAGLISAALLVCLVLWTIASAISGRRIGALLLFLACYTGWNIVSSPLWSSEPAMIAFLGLVLPLRRPEDADEVGEVKPCERARDITTVGSLSATRPSGLDCSG